MADAGSDAGSDAGTDVGAVLLLSPHQNLPELLAASASQRSRTLIVGVDDSAVRAVLLRRGFGDVLGGCTTIDELAARAERVAGCAPKYVPEHVGALPRQQQLGELVLDLLLRDVLIDGRRIGLHPREFALLWRLTEADGNPVAADVLRRDVWGLTVRPETNSLAVHISRLRAKLRGRGQHDLIRTESDGGYRINWVEPSALLLPLAELAPAKLPLDDYVRLRDEAAGPEQDADDAARLQTKRADCD